MTAVAHVVERSSNSECPMSDNDSDNAHELFTASHCLHNQISLSNTFIRPFRAGGARVAKKETNHRRLRSKLDMFRIHNY